MHDLRQSASCLLGKNPHDTDLDLVPKRYSQDQRFIHDK